jgi:hypothetical protein
VQFVRLAFFGMKHNVMQLGEVAEFKALIFNLAPQFI